MDFFSESVGKNMNMLRTTLGWILNYEMAHKVSTSREIAKMCSSRVYNKPKQPRITDEYVWDPAMVIDYYAKHKDNKDLSLMELTKKTAILLLLVTGRRPNDIHNMSLSHCSILPTRIIFTLPTYMKTSKKVKDRQIVIRKYAGCEKVCPYRTVLHYISVTEKLRSSNQLLVTTTGKFSAVAQRTISGWTKKVMTAAGIDISYFKPYSTRSAAASDKARQTGSFTEVIKMGWWKNTSTFFQFYLRKVKYFTRDNTTENDHSIGNNVPASPVRKRANHALAWSKKVRQKRVSQVPHTDLPPQQQGFDEDKHSDLFRSPRSVNSSSGSSVFQQNFKNTYHPIATPPALEGDPNDKITNESVKKCNNWDNNTQLNQNVKPMMGHSELKGLLDDKEDYGEMGCFKIPSGRVTISRVAHPPVPVNKTKCIIAQTGQSPGRYLQRRALHATSNTKELIHPIPELKIVPTMGDVHQAVVLPALFNTGFKNISFVYTSRAIEPITCQILLNDRRIFISENISLATQVCQHDVVLEGHFLPLFSLEFLHNDAKQLFIDFFSNDSFLDSARGAGFIERNIEVHKAMKGLFLITDQHLFEGFIVPMSHKDLVQLLGLDYCFIMTFNKTKVLVISVNDHVSLI